MNDWLLFALGILLMLGGFFLAALAGKAGREAETSKQRAYNSAAIVCGGAGALLAAFAPGLLGTLL